MPPARLLWLVSRLFFVAFVSLSVCGESRLFAQSSVPVQGPFEADPSGMNHSLEELTDSIAEDFNDPDLAQDIQQRVSAGTLVIGELEFRPPHDTPTNRELFGGSVGKHFWWEPGTNGGKQVIAIDTRCSLAQAVARLLHELQHLEECTPPATGSGLGRSDPTTNTNSNDCADCNHAEDHAQGFNRLAAIECGEPFPTNLFPGLGDALGDHGSALKTHLARCASSVCPAKDNFTAANLLNCCEAYFQFPELCP